MRPRMARRPVTRYFMRRSLRPGRDPRESRTGPSLRPGRKGAGGAAPGSLAGLQEGDKRFGLVGAQRPGERGHVATTVRDADHEVVLREQGADVGQVRAAAPAVVADEVAVEAGL